MLARTLRHKRLATSLTAGSIAAVGVGKAASSLLAMFINAAEPEDAVVPSEPHVDQIAQLIAQLEGGRRFVAPEEENYEAIVRVSINGGHCSGAISIFDDYTLADGRTGTIVTSAGHCYIDQQGNVIDPATITAETTYTDQNGEERTFRMTTLPELWVNDAYLSEVRSGEPRVSSKDNAILFFPNEITPPEITPITQYVFSYHMGEFNEYKIGTIATMVAGHSADLGSQLSADDNCDTSMDMEGSPVTADCIINKGASGTGLLARDFDDSIVSYAVLSGGTGDGNGNIDIHAENFESTFAPFYHYQLRGEDTIPFLEHREICATVTGGPYTNLRLYANIGSEPIERLYPDISVFRVASMMEPERAEIGDENVWIEVIENPAGDTGYVRADFVHEVPCPRG